MDNHFTVLWDHGHIKFWSRSTLTKALEETGFKVDAFKVLAGCRISGRAWSCPA
jgi:hypothetical protein